MRTEKLKLSTILSKGKVELKATGLSHEVKAEADKKGKKDKKVICNNIDLLIEPGEIVAIIGASGAGKSTVMKFLSGYVRPQKGEVYIDGISLYKNYNELKKIIAYVPQSDIVHDNLKLFDMLYYAAKIRLLKHVTKKEIIDKIEDVLKKVQLQDDRNTMINKLSGGQRKRASIAVELLSNPKLFFLDEPTSGLDYGTEFKFVTQTLKGLSMEGITVVFVTHSLANIKRCDKIIFVGNGGNLCFYGKPDDFIDFCNNFCILHPTYFEGVTSNQEMLQKFFIGINKNENAETLKEFYEKEYKFRANQRNVLPQTSPKAIHSPKNSKQRKQLSFISQTVTLVHRQIHIMFHDIYRTIFILMQAPILGSLIRLVADGNQFVNYYSTQNLLFVLACTACWIGISNSIQEVCKERDIVKREYMSGLRLSAYIISKLLVFSLISFVQSVSLVTTFGLLTGLPSGGVLGDNSSIEIFFTTFLTILASSSMGVLVSSRSKNSDRAMAIAPLLLLPQLLFSGVIFELGGLTKVLSYLTVSRWAMQGYGTIANLNALGISLNQSLSKLNETVPEMNQLYEFTQANLLYSWGILCGIIIFCIVLSIDILKSIFKE